MRCCWLIFALAGCVRPAWGKAAESHDQPPEDTGPSWPWPTDSGVDEGDPDDTGGLIETPDDPEDPTLCDPIELPETVAVDDACVSEPVTGTLGALVEWSITEFEGYPEYSQILSAPVVGQLTDDNGDGVAGPDDVPDIIASFDDAGTEDSAHGVLRWISGDGSANELILDRWVDEFGDQFFPYRYASPALGDINGDGFAEIVSLFERVSTGPADGGPPDDGGPPPDDDTDHPVAPPPPPSPDGEGPPPIPCHIGALHIDGTVLWMSDEHIDCGGHAPALADLEGDGTVEVVVGSSVFEGSSGTQRFQGPAGAGGYLHYVEIGLIPAISDLDGDGQQEILAGHTIYSPSGEVVCTNDVPGSDGFTAAADLDLDGQGEVVIVGNSVTTVMESDCTVTASWTLDGDGNGGPPTVADFDADGAPEIGVATGTTYTVFEADGAVLWSVPVNDSSSHATGSTVFDFEGDGRPEVVYGDETHLYILDGLTGTVRLADPSHTSRTLHEYPIVVDVDGDGQPEIIIPNGGGHPGSEQGGLYVLGSADGSWLGGRRTGNQHAYNLVNINDDLSRPATPDSNWPLHNNFRSGDLNPVYGQYAPDAVPLGDVCMDDCPMGLIRLGVAIGNQGTAMLRNDLSLSVYRATEPEWTLISVTSVTPPIAPGEASSVLTVDVDATGVEDLVIVVDDAGGVDAVRECDETNNVLVITEAVCP